MKKSQSDGTFLPLIMGRSAQKTTIPGSIYNLMNLQSNTIIDKKANSISKILKQVRQSMRLNIQEQKNLEKQKKNKQQKRKKRQSYLTRKQKKIYFNEETPVNQNNTIQTRQTKRKLSCMVPASVQISEFQTMQKPPHRSKTAMCTDGAKIYIYGGLGCEPNLKLAIYDIESKQWSFPTEDKNAQYHLSVPIIGHSFGCYKGKGYVYGGKSADIMNELTILNLRDFRFTQGERCNFRRKQHATTMISKFMVVQGGVSATQVSNEMFFYNTQTNNWTYPAVSSTLPFLSNHSMTSTYPFKSKKKPITTFSQISDSIFIFGGQDKKGNLSNSLYKVCFQNDTFVATKVELMGNIWPQRKMQMAFHSIGAGYILLYGGKMAQGWDEENFYDREQNLYAYHTDKQQWSKLSAQQPLQDHYGMASTECNGKVYVFGGIQNNMYTNGNVTMLNTWSSDLMLSKSNCGTRLFLRKETIA